MGVFAKIAKVTAETKAIAKEGRNEGQKYDYVRWKETAEAVRRIASEVGLALSTSVVKEEHEFRQETDQYGKTKTASWSFIELKLDMTDTERKSEDGIYETYSITAHGAAKDFGDKAVYKATTGALKYALRQAFLLPDTDDDPEADEAGDGPKPVKAPAKVTPINEPKPVDTEAKPQPKAEEKQRFTAPQGKDQEPKQETSKAAQYVPAAKLHELLRLVQKLSPDTTVEQAKAKIVDEAGKLGVTNLKAMTQAQYVKLEDSIRQMAIA